MTKILLADDDHNFATILKKELEEENHQVDHVSNGVDAILKCIANPYDCVVLDLVMPGIDGLGALKIIKRLKPDVPVITISGKAGPREMADAMACGAHTCLKKPFELEVLKKEIQTIRKERRNGEL
ncbi:MAG: response regulator [Treponemataceae bacterium]|nr:response regulator [Treponemataceae bacterium]